MTSSLVLIGSRLMERLVSEARAQQLFDSRGVRPIDPQLAERLAAMQVGDVFVIDPLPVGVSPRALKVFYNQAARVAGCHLRWRKGDHPVAAQVVAEPTADELRAEQKRLATRRRLNLRAMTSDLRVPHEMNGLVDHQALSSALS